MENMPSTRYESLSDKECHNLNKVSNYKIFKRSFNKIQIILPKNIKNNSENMIQETNHKELSPPQKQQSKNLCPKQISQNSQKAITDSQDIKMDIEFNDLK